MSASSSTARVHAAQQKSTPSTQPAAAMAARISSRAPDWPTAAMPNACPCRRNASGCERAGRLGRAGAIASSRLGSGLTFCPKSATLSLKLSEEAFVTDYASRLGAGLSASTLIVLFVPSHDRSGHAIDQDHWVGEALRVLGGCFGGATAFPQGRGVWRDDAQEGELLFDAPVVIQCYTSEAELARQTGPLRRFLHRMGRDARQGAVGLVIDRDYLEIRSPFDPEDEVMSDGEEH
jgi:hypothetical protein